MWDLIKKDFNQKQRLLYLFDAILIVYTIGVGLGSRFELIIPPATFMQPLGTGIYVITDIMILLTAITFTGKKTRQRISADLVQQISYDQIFWSKIINLFIDYLDLVIVAFASSLVAQRFIFRDKFLNYQTLHTMGISIGANFMLVFLLVAITILFSTLIKSIRGAIAAGIGFQYLGSVLAAPIMILLYHHKWLKWNPFNCLFVQFQINSPINHTMTKLSMLDSITSTIIYGLIYLFFAYLLFSKFNRTKKHQTN